METKNRKLFSRAAGIAAAVTLMGNTQAATVMASGIGVVDTTVLLDIHAEASDASAVLGQVVDEGHVAILEQADGWFRIQAGEIIGWVPQGNLIETEISCEEAQEANQKVIAEITEEIQDAVSVENIQGNLVQEDQESTALQVQQAAAVSPEEVELLASIIYCEAGGEPYVGKVAVGSVVMNRVNHGEYPNTIRDVIYDRGQFSPVRNGSMQRALQNDSADVSCYQAAWEALAGVKPVEDKLYFRRVNGRPGQVIGNHVFY